MVSRNARAACRMIFVAQSCNDQVMSVLRCHPRETFDAPRDECCICALEIALPDILESNDADAKTVVG